MPLTLAEAIEAAKKVLDNSGYTYYVVTSGEVNDDGTQWILRINSLGGRRTIFVNRDTGEVLRISDDEKPRDF